VLAGAGRRNATHANKRWDDDDDDEGDNDEDDED
jgi:hypothetical protein